ncbi:MAG: hypothetical protein LBP75_00100 [Planctomycetota bacterium]|jgi:hypothetical protein|nr:hypothetical protein [Planctomycetota bacterium]
MSDARIVNFTIKLLEKEDAYRKVDVHHVAKYIQHLQPRKAFTGQKLAAYGEQIIPLIINAAYHDEDYYRFAYQWRTLKGERYTQWGFSSQIGKTVAGELRSVFPTVKVTASFIAPSIDTFDKLIRIN